jgi:chemotaxis protein histidine kinase CheA
MTEEVITENQEPKANPYNAKKDWHNVEDKPFVSSNSLFFDTNATTEHDESDAIEAEKQEIEAVKDKPYKQPNYKKRYDDLKTHYDSRLNEFKAREQELLDEAVKNRPDYRAPKSPEELEQFKNEYPDVMAVVETVAHLESESKTRVLEERLSALQDRENELVRKDAETNLREKHPDFDEIRNSDDFQEWANLQPESIKDWIFNNPDDATLASRALDLFKKDIGLEVPQGIQPKSNSKQTQQSAADMISTKTTSVNPNQQRVWSEREISAMSVAEFDKYESEISDAMQEGRIIK